MQYALVLKKEDKISKNCHLWATLGPHPKSKVFFAEIAKTDHKLLKPFISSKYHVLTELSVFLYFA